MNVPVTVTYPDGTQDHVTVPVTTNEQADNDAYQPTTDEVTKDYGTPTTEDDVTGAVTIPDYPSEKENQQSQLMIQAHYRTVIRQVQSECSSNSDISRWHTRSCDSTSNNKRTSR